MVLHSPWWIEEHWGRAFEILSLVPDGFGKKPWLDHGYVLMRKRAQPMEAAELERIAPGDVRETRALVHNIHQLRSECADLRTRLTYAEELKAGKHIARAQQEAADANDRAAASTERILAVELELALGHARAFTLQEELEARQELIEELRAEVVEARAGWSRFEQDSLSANRVIAAMKRSASWRVTAPLRAGKRLLGR